MSDLFDAAAMYDEDYLHFFAAPRGLSEFAGHGPVVPGADSVDETVAELAWRLLDLRPGMSVLDLACGHGALATPGAEDGLDSASSWTGPARRGRRGVSVDRVVAARDNGDMLVDRYHLDALTGRFEAERTVIRSGRTRRVIFVKRLFGFPELRDWLLAAGFTAVTGYGEDGQPLTAGHQRMVIVADLP